MDLSGWVLSGCALGALFLAAYLYRLYNERKLAEFEQQRQRMAAKRLERETTLAEAREADTARFRPQITRLHFILTSKGWADSHKSNVPKVPLSDLSLEGNRVLLFLGHEKTTVEIVSYTNEDATEVKIVSEFSLKQGDVLSVETRDIFLDKTRKKEIRTPMTVQTGSQTSKSRSPVARGLVGAALLGPVGAIVGAASGLKNDQTHISSSQIVEHVSHQTETYSEFSQTELLITIRNLEAPLLRISSKNKATIDLWKARLSTLVGNP
jgi:hypothetical protein